MLHVLGPMKKLNMLSIIAAVLTFALRDVAAAESYEEPHWETKNPARICDCDTLKFLLSTKVEKASIKAESTFPRP
jgi:hypothetical protein